MSRYEYYLDGLGEKCQMNYSSSKMITTDIPISLEPQQKYFLEFGSIRHLYPPGQEFTSLMLQVCARFAGSIKTIVPKAQAADWQNTSHCAFVAKLLPLLPHLKLYSYSIYSQNHSHSSSLSSCVSVGYDEFVQKCSSFSSVRSTGHV